MFSLGFSTIGCPDYDIDQVIAIARQNGYTGIEIRFLRGTVDLAGLAEFGAAGIGETRRRFEDAGIKVVGINTGVRMVSLDPSVRATQMEAAKANLAIAEGLGADYLRVFGGPLPKEQDREKTLDAVAQGLGEVADMTAQSGVTTLIETHDAFCRSEAVLDLYARGMSDKLEVLWDTLHTHRHGESPDYTWQRLGPKVRLVHVKDSVVATPEAFDFALTGEGTVPITAFLDLLADKGFEGFVNFEWERGWHPEIPAPEIALPHFMAYIDGWRAGK
jgi:sugar phosphate isomerase/epimerase